MEEIEIKATKPTIRIQQLKNELIILGNTLYQNEKINKSLYNQIEELTYSKRTEIKLKESLNALKHINTQVLSGAAEKRETKIH